MVKLQERPDTPVAGAGLPGGDIQAMSDNMVAFAEAAGRLTSAYMRPWERGEARSTLSQEAAREAFVTLGEVTQTWMSDPARAWDAQARLGRQFMDLWSHSLKRMGGEDDAPVAVPARGDKRFQDPDWSRNAAFDFVKQAFLVTSRWAEAMVDEAEGLSPHIRDKARFYVRQMAGAMAPTNFVATNPELIRETLRENGANLVRGMRMLAEDVEAGGGELKVRHSDVSQFRVGENIAVSPGKVVFRNDLIELIQYSPATETVLARPLLIIPPWINKFYILDLNREKSFIGWAVAQGLTVFCVSWVNPDERQAAKSFDAYMHEGILAACDAIERATGERSVTAIGYCVGGTLLAVTLAYLAATGSPDRIASATFFTTQVDFTHAGELKIFVDEAQVQAVEATMKARGYLEGSRMANAFNMLRPNDLIWPYVVNVYLKGQAPFPFDLLYWNADATRMPAANHSFYLRNCYLDNKLARGEMEIDGTRLDLGRITIPIFNLATREDHIAPAVSVFAGSQLFGGPVDFVVAGSGHIAGVVNPPTKPKYGYWTGDVDGGTLEDWLGAAEQHEGSWWPYWFGWIERQAPERVPAREPGTGELPALCDAPGTYVRVKA